MAAAEGAPPAETKGAEGAPAGGGLGHHVPAAMPGHFPPTPPLEVATGSTLDPARPLLNGFIRDRPAFSHVEVRLMPGQKVIANAKAMIWMDGHVRVDTKCADCCEGCWRTCAGESCCQNEFTGPQGGGAVTFALDLPGDMLPFGVMPGEGNGWVIAAGGYVCGTPNVSVSARFAGCAACCCGDVAPWLVKATVKPPPAGQAAENGMFWAGSYGALTRHDIPEGKTLFLDNGLFFAANEKVNIGLGLPGSCISCCYGKEGVVMKFTGPAVVYSQNRSPAIWAKVLNPPGAKKKKKKGGSAVSNALSAV